MRFTGFGLYRLMGIKMVENGSILGFRVLVSKDSLGVNFSSEGHFLTIWGEI